MELLELTEMVRESASAGMEAITLYLTVVTGYILVGYTAGKNVSKYLNFLVTSIFVAFSLFFVAGTWDFFYAAYEYSTRYGPELGMDPVTIWYARTIVAVELMGIVGSLVYMYQVRKS